METGPGGNSERTGYHEEMIHRYSEQVELFLEQMIAEGVFGTREAAIEAAVTLLREQTQQIPFVPDEHMEEVERAIEESDQGSTTPMTPADWETLRQLARSSAGRKASTSE
jgi:Arc/MetJ-type ribon-helix-helix transcriptional regulator